MAAKDEIILVADYNPRWPMLYDRERELILKWIGEDVAAIEHIGSTSVPGLGAKPIIDIMVGVRSVSPVPGDVSSRSRESIMNMCRSMKL
jgi:GrpB-like predicted nucleotidyltransferase (UPF0157 family)